jgi:hypothetical protein
LLDFMRSHSFAKPDENGAEFQSKSSIEREAHFPVSGRSSIVYQPQW